LRDREEELRKRNVEVVVVTFEAGLLALGYAEETSLQWPLLVDADRVIYREYGMLSASFGDVWGPRTWWAYLKAILHGDRPRKSEGDIYQRGGDMLVDPEGIVRFHHVGKGPSDRPSVDEILARVRPA
jgi:hypothetical protein